MAPINVSRVASGIRVVALVEAAKAVVVLLAGFGVLTLVHRDVHAFAAQLVERLHLDPANKYPRIFIDAVSRLTDARLWLLASLAMIYAVVRAVEAYGLWRGRAWAEWFALVTGGIYLPIELYELTQGITSVKVAACVINIAIVGYMAYALCRSKQNRKTELVRN
jgi:uncharacterized membrane protein (DUF2068 family)